MAVLYSAIPQSDFASEVPALKDVAFPYYEALWSMVTAAAQHAAGVSVTPSVTPPLWVLTPSNAPDTSQAFPVVLDYKAQYEAARP